MSGHPPKVFISYKQGSDAHNNRVLELAQALRIHGMDVELDQFHATEILDWPQWCDRNISADYSDFVLCVCTEDFCQCIDDEVPVERGRGVAWEAHNMRNELYGEKGNRRIIPVLYDDEPEKSIPRFLRGWTYCRMKDFVLEDEGYQLAIRILSGQALVEPIEIGEIPDLPTKKADPVSATAKGDLKISPTRLHHGAETLFGREEELKFLDEAWKNPATKVVTIVAWGGVGKTSLVAEWMARQAAKGWPGFERVFDWSFYSQGTRDQGAPSADTFIKEALVFFGDKKTANSAKGPWDKGARLAQLVAQHRTLLVLDGLEPLQYSEASPTPGQLKDPAISALLKGLAANNQGLCVVTTREKVDDLKSYRKTTAPEYNLDHLSTDAGVELLKSEGVKGTEQEYRSLVEEVKGHALTLNIIGCFLKKAYDGDIRKRDLFKLETVNQKIQGGHAFRVLETYEKWFRNEGTDEALRALAVLRLMGLFDRPADAGCIHALRNEPAITGLTEPLVNLGDSDWEFTLSLLEDCGLISKPDAPETAPVASSQQPAASLDSHPLVREYFAKQLQDNNPDAWRAAHERLYRHLCDTTEHQPDTLEGLQPLYQAVAHGCQAGLYQRVCEDVYRDRILRGTGLDGFYSTFKLGAIGADLGAIACFFVKPWTQLASSLKESDRAWLLSEAAFRLRALGRLKEALEPMRVNLKMRIDREEWQHVAISASNLSELELTLGRVAQAVEDSKQSVFFADKSGDEFARLTTRVRHADGLHQAGKNDAARSLFVEAEEMQIKRQPEYPLLYSVQGFQYCDLLLGEVEYMVWCKGITEQADTVEEIFETIISVENRARKTLEWAEGVGADLLTIANEHLTLGRAALYKTLLTDSMSEKKDALEKARTELTAAMDGLRQAGQQDYIPHGLLSRAWLRVVEGDYAGSQADLDEAWEISSRGPMRLFMCDIHLYRARLFHGQTPYPWEGGWQRDLDEAEQLIEECGYHRRDRELADARAASENWG